MSAAVPASPRSRDSVRQRWLARFDRFAAAGLSVTAFCRKEGVSSQAFYYWKQKLAAQTQVPAAGQPRLLPVRLLAAPSPAPVEVVLPHGTVLRLAPGCDLAFVRSLVDTLGGALC
jgi:transposase